MSRFQLFQSRNFVLREALRLAQEFGVHENDVLERLGSERASIWRMGGMLPADSSMEAIEIAAELSGRADFGLELGARTDERILASVMVFLAHCTSLAQMCAEVSNYMNVLYGGVRYGAPLSGQDAVVQFDVLATGHPLPHYVTTMLILPVRLFRQIFGPAWSPVAVRMTHPALVAQARYRDVFGCEVTFGAPANVIEVSAQDWRRPIDIRATRVQEAVDSLLDVAQSSVSPREDLLVPRIVDTIRSLMPAGDASARRVAERLNMSTRSMQRSLAERGTTFSDVRRDAMESGAPGRLKSS